MKRRSGIAGAVLVLWTCLFLWGCADDERIFPSEGSTAEPVNIGTAPLFYSGTVGGSEESYYRSDTSSDLPNETWQFVISNIDGDPDLDVFGDSAYSDLLCSSANRGTTPESCEVECVDLCEFFIRVTGVSLRGASYTLSIAPFVSELALRR